MQHFEEADIDGGIDEERKMLCKGQSSSRPIKIHPLLNILVHLIVQVMQVVQEL